MSWQPPIFPKQARLAQSNKQLLLACGPRLSGKTQGCEHAVLWHLWDTPRAVGMMLGKTISQNNDSGPWTHLTQTVIPTWCKADFGMELITPVRMDAITHKLYFEVTNRFYEEDPSIGVSRMYLDSLDNEPDAEDKFKGKFFSLIYWTELSNFKKRKTLDVLRECLRCDWLREDQQRILADTNPAEEGTDSWIWKLWYWFRTVDLDNLNEDTKEDLNLNGLSEEELALSIADLKMMQADIEVVEFTIDDNTFLTPKRKRNQRSIYSHDKDLLDRYYYGRWVRASGDGIFSEVFRPQIHLIGEPSQTTSDGSNEPEFMLPEENCIEMGTGSDIGRRNTAVVFIEPIQMEFEEDGPAGKQMILKPGFKILDEYVSLGEQQSMSDIADAFVEKIEFWEKFIPRRPYWNHYSDNSAFTLDTINETDEAKELYRLTKGLVELESITGRYKGMKGQGSVDRRIDHLQRLLFENRILINAEKCPNVCEMLNSIKRGKTGKLSNTNIFKHVFDSITYYTSMKCWLEMIRVPRIPTNRDSESRVMSVSL